MEYNAFALDVQHSISELRKVARTQIEPRSVKLAKELSGVKPVPATQKKVEEKPAQTAEHKGYYL